MTDAQIFCEERILQLEAALAAERKRVAELDFARESLWNHYRRCTDALGLRFDEVPENPEKELEMWRGLRAKITELERDRERLLGQLKNLVGEIVYNAQQVPGRREWSLMLSGELMDELRMMLDGWHRRDAAREEEVNRS